MISMDSIVWRELLTGIRKYMLYLWKKVRVIAVVHIVPLYIITIDGELET